MPVRRLSPGARTRPAGSIARVGTARPLLAAATLLALGLPALPALAGAAAHPAAAEVRAPGPIAGYDRIGVRRASTWFLRDSLDGGPSTAAYSEATSSWLPVAGDTDGDGTGSLSLFRGGVWQLRDRAGGPVRTFRFGRSGDVPVLGDWNGDGVATIGVFRGGTWYLRNSNVPGPPDLTFVYGAAGDRPFVGDWNGDGRTDIGVHRGRDWYERDDTSAGVSSRSFSFGLDTDLPVAGDWDHDGRDDVAAFRDGAWFFRFAWGGYQSTAFGTRGDLPVVRRTPSLATGLAHRVVRSGGSVVNIARVEPQAAAKVGAVLAGGRLAGFDTTSRMASGAGALLAVNGDFGLSNGRPVHAFASGGVLYQADQLPGRGEGFDPTGRSTGLGFPTVTARLQPAGGVARDIGRWNAGAPVGDGLAAYTAVSQGVEQVPANYCYAGLTPRTPGHPADGGTVQSSWTVTGVRCGGPAPAIPGSDLLVVGQPGTGGESAVQALTANQQVDLTQQLGFPGSADLLGASEGLVSGGRVNEADVSGPGDYTQGLQPRTALGRQADGSLVIVAVDGRRSGWSSGMSLRQLAQLLVGLGVTDAVNLDGGGSTTMWVDGLVVNRPSDNVERAVDSALVVRPTVPRPVALQPSPPATSGPDVRPWWRAAHDPGSTGGLADSLLRRGAPSTRELQRAAGLFRAR